MKDCDFEGHFGHFWSNETDRWTGIGTKSGPNWTEYGLGSNLFGPFWARMTLKPGPVIGTGPKNGPEKIIYLMDNEVWFLNRVVIWDKTFIFHFLLVSQLSQFCLAGCLFCLTDSLKNGTEKDWNDGELFWWLYRPYSYRRDWLFSMIGLFWRILFWIELKRLPSNPNQVHFNSHASKFFCFAKFRKSNFYFQFDARWLNKIGSGIKLKNSRYDSNYMSHRLWVVVHLEKTFFGIKFNWSILIANSILTRPH